jgi:hypothetical protein
MEKKKYIKFLLFIILIVGLLGCTTITFDEYLENPSIKNSAIIFDCNVLKADSNMLVLMGMNKASIPSEAIIFNVLDFFI